MITVRLADRFGDAGLVGACILRYAGQQAVIDTLLLSCRVLGRGVEDALLVQCLKRARSKGCRLAIGEYRPTPKNAQVADFYAKHAFFAAPADGEARRFTLDLTTFAAAEPRFFKRIDSDIAAATGAAEGQG